MVALLLTTTISCSDALSIFNRVQKVIGLTPRQKTEIILIIRKSIPSCPIRIETNGRTK
jgi:hypothetical protein